jgi:hypothetical protein
MCQVDQLWNKKRRNGMEEVQVVFSQWKGPCVDPSEGHVKIDEK